MSPTKRIFREFNRWADRTYGPGRYWTLVWWTVAVVLVNYFFGPVVVRVLLDFAGLPLATWPATPCYGFDELAKTLSTPHTWGRPGERPGQTKEQIMDVAQNPEAPVRTCPRHETSYGGAPFTRAQQSNHDWIDYARYAIGPLMNRDAYLAQWALRHEGCA
jgi:hypothetical protein